jgi:hypothetical protein
VGEWLPCGGTSIVMVSTVLHKPLACADTGSYRKCPDIRFAGYLPHVFANTVITGAKACVFVQNGKNGRTSEGSHELGH